MNGTLSGSQEKIEQPPNEKPYSYFVFGGADKTTGAPRVMDCEEYLDYIAAIPLDGRKVIEKDGSPVVPDFAIKTNPKIAWARIMRGRSISYGHFIAKYVPSWKSFAINTGKKRSNQGRRKRRFEYVWRAYSK